jgi:hypothetical protein
MLDLEHVSRDLLNALGNRPAVLGLERNRLENQKIEGSLHEIAGLAHTMIIYTKRLSIVGVFGLLIRTAAPLLRSSQHNSWTIVRQGRNRRAALDRGNLSALESRGDNLKKERWACAKV